MKKYTLIIFSLVSLISNCTGCDSETDLPGEERVWWFQGFNDFNDATSFILDLYDAQENGNFNFGLSTFTLPKQYKCLSTVFSGHIDINTSNKEDIYNSKYDHFEIKSTYIEDTINTPIYNLIYVYFYPFYSINKIFNNSGIEFNCVAYDSGAYEVIFKYDDTIIMKAMTTKESSVIINKEEMINELIQNYQIIV